MHPSSESIDGSSRLRQFSWEQWDDQFIAVIFRPSSCGLDRFVVKRYVEHVLFQSGRWKQISLHFSNISTPIRAYSLTSHEIELVQRILDYHLGKKLGIRLTQSSDQLIGYEDLLDFISRAQERVRSNGHNDTYTISGKQPIIPSTLSSYVLPSSITPPTPLPPTPTEPKTYAMKLNPILIAPPMQVPKPHTSKTGTHVAYTATGPANLSIPPELHLRSFTHAKIDGSGWVQINNVYLPFLVKNRQRLVPHQILVACKILEPDELRSVLIRSSSTDINLINTMIRDCKINNEQVPGNALLINVRHVLIGTKNLVYIKILPKDAPTSKINRQYKSVLASHGGSLLIATRLVPFVCASNHTYLPLDDILHIYPNLYTQLKSFVRVPRANELDYLQLVQMYCDGKELPSDAVVIDMTNLNQVQITPSRSMTLSEQHAREKSKFEQQIRLLINKRKHPEGHDAKQTQRKLKPSNQFQSSLPTASIRPPTGYFPAPATHHPVNHWHSPNNGPGGRAH